MASLPNHEHALIERSKLLHYALSPRSERGRHKTRVFDSALGFKLSNWEALHRAILGALPHHEARLSSETPFGRKYEARLALTGPDERTEDVVTVWQYDRLPDGTLGDVPRLVTLYIP
jgi:hypothetical protein